MLWRNTTHDWANSVDVRHLAEVRQHPARFAPVGTLHLILEVIAYAADEAKNSAEGQCVVTLHNDGSVAVADDERGTVTRCDEQGGHGLRPPAAAGRAPHELGDAGVFALLTGRMLVLT